MKNNAYFKERVLKFEAMFDFVVGGICEHLRTDQPDVDQITDALIALKESFWEITKEMQE